MLLLSSKSGLATQLSESASLVCSFPVSYLHTKVSVGLFLCHPIANVSPGPSWVTCRATLTDLPHVAAFLPKGSGDK